MIKSLVIARCTILEMMRERIFLVMITLGALLLLLSLLLGELTLAEQAKVIADIGFGTVELASVIFVAFSGSFVIAKELEKQTILIVLARPISRMNFLLGKFLGALAVASLMVIGLSLLVLVLLGSPAYFVTGLVPILGTLLQITIVASLAFLLSNMVRPTLALSFTILVYFAGHWLPDVEFLATQSGNEKFMLTIKGLKLIIPNLYRFNWKNYFILELPPPVDEILWATAHTFVWSFFALSLALVFFKKRDFV